MNSKKVIGICSWLKPTGGYQGDRDKNTTVIFEKL